MRLKKADVELEGFLRSIARKTSNACGSQTGKALSCYSSGFGSASDATTLRFQLQSSVTQHGPVPLMSAGLKVSHRRLPLAGHSTSLIIAGNDFCVGPACALRESFAQYFARW